jgi:hypothetical protein
MITDVKLLFAGKEPNISGHMIEIFNWLYGNIQKSYWAWHWIDQAVVPTLVVTFSNEHDALMFKIMFSGIVYESNR